MSHTPHKEPYTYQQAVADCQAADSVGRAYRARCMEALAGLDGFDWCGVYRLEGETLVLDEYVGAPTDHTQIPVGVGVCGTAVAEDRDQIIEDVRELENYLSCSLETRSEAVVLIKRDGQTLGQIDIDGHRVGTFGQEETALLREIAGLIAGRWDEQPEP